MKNTPTSTKIGFNGAVDREGPPLVPHAAAFPSAMMSLGVLMGLHHDTHEIRLHGRQWRADHDYNMQYALSGEGFKFLFDTAEYFRFSLPEGAAPLRDCFAAIGAAVKVYSCHGAAGLDGGWASEEALTALVTGNLAAGMPVLLLGRTAADRVLLATGYENGGETLIAWTFVPGNDMPNKSFSPEDCQFIAGWRQGVDAVALVRGMPERPAREALTEVYRRALKRAAEFLRAGRSAPYGKDVPYWDHWIASLMDDTFWATDFQGFPFIYPEIWDLAERRFYMAAFLEQAGEVLQTDKLGPGVEAGEAVHSKMWEIHALCQGENKSAALKDRDTRRKIAQILETCRALDLQMAAAIEEV